MKETQCQPEKPDELTFDVVGYQRWISSFDVEIQFPSVSSAGRIAHIVCSVAFPVQRRLPWNHETHSSQLFALKRSC